MAMSIIWMGMVAAAMIYAALHGTGAALSGAVAAGAKQAVELSLTMAGSLCLWSGFAALLRESLCGNATANLLGLGNAATPLGIAAVRRMQALSGGRAATDEACRLIVMNTASIQLLPTTVAALRAGLGSASPFAILPAVWATSLLSVSAGLLAARVLQKWL